MDEQQLPQLELLCQQLYESTDSQVRTQAEKALVQFSDSPDSFHQCQFVLERSQNPYALLLAASTLTKLVTKANCNISIQDRLQLRNYVLQFLGSRLGMVNYITQAMVQLIARMTKHGWYDGDKKVFVFRDILDEVGKFLRGSVEHCVVGVQILYHLVMEMNLPDSMRSVSNHRKVASSFRDESLQDIFTLSCTLLRQINVHDKAQHELMNWLLKLACSCLSFNFIGTATDESVDDLTTVQIPSNWRHNFLDFSTLHLFFNLLHSMSAHEISAMAISCVVQIASIRRSLFTTVERSNFLTQIVKGVIGILEQPQTLANPECYHEFCRLLLRIKSNYQLGELLRLDDYSKFIELIAKFTVSSLRSWQFSSNSIHYLLGFWQKLVGSIPYIKNTETHLLDKYIPEITKVYVTSRLESVEEVLRDHLDNPLDDQTHVLQQLDQMSVIARCEFDSTCVLLVNVFDQTAASYQKLLQTHSHTDNELALREGQLTWLIFLIGSVIGGRVDRYYSSDSDTMDGQLISRAIKLMDITDRNLPQHGSEYLYRAYIYFFEHFKMVYIDDSVNKNSKIYEALSENLGLSNESMVLNVYITKIVTFLKYWSNNKIIVGKTLQLFYELSMGYTSARKLLKLDSIQFILENHTPEQFPFLSRNLNLTCHTIFYRALGRLLLTGLGEDEEDKFDRFIAPLTITGDRIEAAFLSQTSDQDDLKRMVIAFCRDLRGLTFSFCFKSCYLMLFDWIYPKYTGVLLKALDLWYYDQDVTTPILKLVAEIAQNKSQRIGHVTSPNGVLLFREVSKVISCYGEHILTLSDIPMEKLYDLKLKGVSISFRMLKEALCGGYVNFGVFRLYGDDALDKALNMFVKLLMSIPLKTLLEYPKLSKAYYGMLEVLTLDHMEFICSLEPDVFVYILSSILEGLTGLDAVVCTGCCGTLDHIITFFFKNLSKSKRKESVSQQTSFLRLLELHSELFQQMLSTIMNTVMFDRCRQQWSMSRPLLGLILLNEDYFHTWRQGVVSLQPIEKQSVILNCLDNLMDSIERNLQHKNRDIFTKNLSLFCQDIDNSMKEVVSEVPEVLVTAANSEMMS